MSKSLAAIPRILAINPGSRYLGIAVFHGAELRDWGVKVTAKSGLEQRLDSVKSIVAGLVEQYHITALAIKKLHRSRSSANLNRLVGAIKEIAKGAGLKIYEYPVKFMESALGLRDKANKKLMAEAVSGRFPFLQRELEKEKANLNPYHIRMFEAVGVGLICSRQLENKN